MGDHHLIPLSDATKDKWDVAAILGAVLAFLKVIPWPEIAAGLACVYTLMRIVELIWQWSRKR